MYVCRYVSGLPGGFRLGGGGSGTWGEYLLFKGGVIIIYI